MKLRTPINKQLVESRMQQSFDEYLQSCITSLEQLSDRGMLNGLGEMMEDENI